jgi:putative ABC transport system ATP-binding protein
MLAGQDNASARQRALELLTALDVQHRAGAQVSQLSGGEQQRVAIARSLANHAPVILADEPTAPLDSERALTVVRILNDLAREYRTAIIVVTHDEKIIPTFKRTYHIRDGKTHEEAGEGATDLRLEKSALARRCFPPKLAMSGTHYAEPVETSWRWPR